MLCWERFQVLSFVENLINYDAFSPDSHECCDEEVKEIGMCVGTYFPGL